MRRRRLREGIELTDAQGFNTEVKDEVNIAESPYFGNFAN